MSASVLGRPALVDETEAAKWLCCSKATLRKARIDRLPSNPLSRLPYVKIGRSVRYRVRDLEAWLDAQCAEGTE